MIETKQTEILQPEINDVLMRILDMNEQIIRQNTLIVRTMTLPAMLVKREDHHND